MTHEHERPALHLAFKIEKLALRAAAVAAAFCIVNEIHNVHKSIEAYKRWHLHTPQDFLIHETEQGGQPRVDLPVCFSPPFRHITCQQPAVVFRHDRPTFF